MPSQSSIGSPFIELRSVDSTNNYAMGLVHAGMAQHGTVVFAHHQTMGKGQRQKQWHSKPDENIAVSVVLTQNLSTDVHRFGLSMAVATSVYRFFSSYAGSETKIKWPNDIYWRDRKAGGILIENIVQGNNWKAAVIGIGLNVNQTAFEILSNKAVSLKQVTGKTFDTLELVKEVVQFLEQGLSELERNSASIKALYNDVLYKINQSVRLKKDSRIFEAVIKGVTDDGKLIVHHGLEEEFSVGAVEWLHDST